tara:strand:+ start:365 stop:673 length:309 start_codon:yes stop_codon:yes gene_type:complete
MNSTMRFHALNSNTSHYLWPHANNHPYGTPPALEDNEMDYSEPTWDDVPDKFINFDDDACKCFSCSGWFPTEDCVINHDEEYKGVPVCDTCAEGKFFVDKIA